MSKKQYTDAERLDWLDWMANKKGGLLLHDGNEKGRLGLGLRETKRTLRQAVDDSMRNDREWLSRD